MITNIHIKNFKSLKDSGKIEFKPITFFVGPNSSGKTSIFQSILLLRQTIRSKDPKSALILQDYIDLGSFKDITWKHKNKDITLKFSDPESTFEIVFAFNNKNQTIYVKKFRSFGIYHSNDKTFNFDYNITKTRKDKKGREYSLNVINHDSYLMGTKNRVELYKFYQTDPEIILPYTTKKSVKLTNENDLRAFFIAITNSSFFRQHNLQLEQIFNKIYHIGPLRREPQRVYSASGAFPLEVGKSGEWVVDELISNTETQEKVKNWFKDFHIASDFKVDELKEGSKRYEIIIKEFHTGEWVNIADVGFGASQILPIIVEGFIAKDSTILIEQPEIHLHPEAQATMGDLLIDIAKNQGNNVLIETHSDLIISRICTRIAQGNIENSDVAIYYLNPTDDGTQIIEISINENGQYQNFPDGFFEERYEEALLKAGYIF